MTAFKELLAIAETPEQMGKLQDWFGRNVIACFASAQAEKQSSYRAQERMACELQVARTIGKQIGDLAAGQWSDGFFPHLDKYEVQVGVIFLTGRTDGR